MSKRPTKKDLEQQIEVLEAELDTLRKTPVSSRVGDGPHHGSRDQFLDIIENIQDGYYEVDLTGNLTFLNDSLGQILGYPREELMGKNYRMYTLPEHVARTFESFNTIYATGKPARAHDWEIVRKDGTRRFVQGSASLIVDGNGQPLGFRGILRDISEHKRIEEELRRHRHRLEEMVQERTSELKAANEKLLVEVQRRKRTEEGLLKEKGFSDAVIGSLPGIFFVLDGEGRVVRWNPATEQATSYSAEEIALTRLPDFFQGADREIVAESIRETLKTGKSVVEAEITTKDGGEIPYLFSEVRTILDDTAHIVGLGIDIAKRKRAEEALAQSEKQLRFLSEQLLTAQEKERKRVAQELHDGIGQSLSAIKFRLENSLEQMDNSIDRPGLESARAVIPVIQDAIEEVRRISMGLRPSTLDDLGILATVKWFCRKFQATYSGIRIDREIDLEESCVPEPIKVVIFRVLQEALNNIAKHAQADRVSLFLGKTDNGIELAIEDNGVGFDSEAVVSAEGPGRGFGLAGMRERTELSGGLFGVKSGVGVGTIVHALWKEPRIGAISK